VLSFAAHNPAHIYLSGRSQASADKLVGEANTKFATISITFLKCDLASLESVKRTPLELLSKTDRLDIGFAHHTNTNKVINSIDPACPSQALSFRQSILISKTDYQMYSR
jgi:hypothetical protein